MSEAIQCLETELDVLRRKRDACQTILTMAVSTGLAFPTTPVVGTDSTQGLALGQLDFSGPPTHRGDADVEHVHKLAPPPTYSIQPSQQLLLDAAVGVKQAELAAAHHHLAHVERQMSESFSSDADDSSGTVLVLGMGKMGWNA
jgi:hypothetical protein